MASQQSRPRPPPKATTTQRLPAPSLFVGPPSQNASNLSIARPVPTNQSDASPPTTPPRTRDRRATISSTASSQPQTTPQRLARPRPSKAKLDAQWIDLQNTLADVELGARTRVFGPGHADALKELRDAQIQLARAWGPSGGSEEEKDRDGSKEDNKGRDEKGTERGDKKERDKVARDDEERRRGERDLSDAAARREANEIYFRQVKSGVQDVVGRLDAVAAAMKKVEMESREIWGEGESLVSATSRGSDG